MTQQDDAQEGAQDIQRQFAQLQAEMQRVMAEQPAAPAPMTDETADFQRIERGLEALRRDADRLRARMQQSPEDAGIAASMADLRAQTEETARQSAEFAKRGEESTSRLARVVQGNREVLEDITLRLDTLAQRQRGGWLVPLAILLGAVIIATAVMLDDPGRIERLIDAISALVSPLKR